MSRVDDTRAKEKGSMKENFYGRRKKKIDMRRWNRHKKGKENTAHCRREINLSLSLSLSPLMATDVD